MVPPTGLVVLCFSQICVGGRYPWSELFELVLLLVCWLVCWLVCFACFLYLFAICHLTVCYMLRGIIQCVSRVYDNALAMAYKPC